MSTVRVEYYDAECVRCGWKHRVMCGEGTGTYFAHARAVAQHANATFGRCLAYPDEIREQAPDEAQSAANVVAEEPSREASSNTDALSERSPTQEEKDASLPGELPDEAIREA